MALDVPIRQAGVREHNLALVLRHLAASPRPISRAGLAAATGLTRATVSALVEELISGRLVAEVAPAPRAGAGRPAHGLRLSADGPAGLGLEVNVDYLAACLIDLTGAVRHHTMRHADQRPRQPEQVLASLAELAAELVEVAAGQGLTVAGAALAVPGLVSGGGVASRADGGWGSSAGLVRLAPNLGWRDLDVPAVLAGTPGFPALPVTVDNEANLAALGELHATRCTDFIYISGEVGIGAGIVLGGRLFRGARGFSGELGHVTVRPDGPLCRCGARGCLEQYAGQETILRAAGDDPGAAAGPAAPAEQIAGPAERIAAPAEQVAAPAEQVAAPAERIVALARAGDPAMLRALRAAGTALGVAAAGVVNLLDVDTVVLGGSYAPAAPWLVEPVRREIGQRVVTAAWAPVTVRASALGPRATVVGAAGAVIRAIQEAPARWLASRPGPAGPGAGRGGPAGLSGGRPVPAPPYAG